MYKALVPAHRDVDVDVDDEKPFYRLFCTSRFVILRRSPSPPCSSPLPYWPLAQPPGLTVSYPLWLNARYSSPSSDFPDILCLLRHAREYRSRRYRFRLCSHACEPIQPRAHSEPCQRSNDLLPDGRGIGTEDFHSYCWRSASDLLQPGAVPPGPLSGVHGKGTTERHCRHMAAIRTRMVQNLFVRSHVQGSGGDVSCYL